MEMRDEAVAELIQSKGLDGESPEAIAALKQAYRVSGLRGYWQKELDLEQEKYQEGLVSGERAIEEKIYLSVPCGQTLCASGRERAGLHFAAKVL